MSVKPVQCKACSRDWPREDHHIIELAESNIYLHDDQFFPGWTVLVLKRHATELFQLTTTERNQLMEEVSTVASALAHVYSALKVNYALLGNLLPHIHWHVIPRTELDPAPQQAVFSVPHKPLRLGHDKRKECLEVIRQAIWDKGQV